MRWDQNTTITWNMIRKINCDNPLRAMFAVRRMAHMTDYKQSGTVSHMASDQFTVRAVHNSRQMQQFITLPREMYRGDSRYVPHLDYERQQFFDPDQNPLFEFTDVEYFLLYDSTGEPAGRITAHINHRHNEYWDERAGCFGFFECLPDPEASAALFNAAEGWLRERNMGLVRGPLNFSTNEECGLLVDGFDTPPAIMMPHNKQYYPALLRKAGYRKARDLLALDYHSDGETPRYLRRVADRIRDRTGIRIRTINMNHFDAEIEKAFRVYNRAWEDNWGFVPMSEAQFRHMADELRPIIDPNIALIAEKDGHPIAFSLSLPDYNRILRKLNGKLLPLGWVRLLLEPRRIDRVRVITLGVVEEYRNSGVDALLYHDTFENGASRGYWSCEMSWILEDNDLMLRALRRMGAERYKTYRIYAREL
ncbi:MAG: N-acetyltransferase [Candidatus Brocadiia bacterium]